MAFQTLKLTVCFSGPKTSYMSNQGPIKENCISHVMSPLTKP